MNNDIDKSMDRLNTAETIRRQAITLQQHIGKALADIQAISGSEDIQISHALTLATLQADQRDEENNIGRMIIRKIAQQGGE